MSASRGVRDVHGVMEGWVEGWNHIARFPFHVSSKDRKSWISSKVFEESGHVQELTRDTTLPIVFVYRVRGSVPSVIKEKAYRPKGGDVEWRGVRVSGIVPVVATRTPHGLQGLKGRARKAIGRKGDFSATGKQWNCVID